MRTPAARRRAAPQAAAASALSLRRPAPQPRQGRRRQAPAQARTRPGHRRASRADLRRVPGRARPFRHRRGTHPRPDPSPSQQDRARNRHWTGEGWSKSAVRTILCNPRYTGRQVWNEQRKDGILLDVNDVAAGFETRMRWNHPGNIFTSAKPTCCPPSTPGWWSSSPRTGSSRHPRDARGPGPGPAHHPARQARRRHSGSHR